MEQKNLTFSVTGSLSDIETICARISSEGLATVTLKKSKKAADTDDDEEEDSDEASTKTRKRAAEKPARRKRAVDPGDEEPETKPARKKKVAQEDEEEDTDEAVSLEKIKKLFSAKQEDVSEEDMDKLFDKFGVDKISDLQKADYAAFHKRLKNL